MRVAALYDIHGNLPALEAVLQELERERVDQVVVGGDVVLGPWPREVLARLAELAVPTHFLRGNCEVAMLGALGRCECTYALPEQVLETVRWAADRLEPNEADELASWPRTVTLEVPGLGRVLFCHATPRDENELFTRSTPEERLLPWLEAIETDVVVCGHTHMQFDRTVGKTRVVNAGSIGLPFGEPGAYWAMLGRDVELRRTSYDLSAVGERIAATGYPQPVQFVEEVVRPRAEAEMVELFATAEGARAEHDEARSSE